MAIKFDGSTQYLSGSSTLLANEPIDLVAQVNNDIDTDLAIVLSLGNSGGTSGGYHINFRGTVVGDPIGFTKLSDAGASGIALTSTGFTANTWHVASGSAVSDTSRNVYIDGGSKGSETTSVSDPTPDFISIGALVRSVVSNYFDGSIAEVYVLDMNVDDAVRAVHEAYGISYVWGVSFGNIRAWYPLLIVSDLQNRVTGGYPNLTATASPTTAEHPINVIYPRINGVMFA